MLYLFLVYAAGFSITLYWSVQAVTERGRERQIDFVGWSILVFCSLVWPLILPWFFVDYLRGR